MVVKHLTLNHLLARVARDVEAEHGDQRDQQTGQNHVEDVEQRFPAYLDSVRHVRIRLRTARVVDDVALDVKLDQSPLVVRYVVGQVAVFAYLEHVYLRTANQ